MASHKVATPGSDAAAVQPTTSVVDTNPEGIASSDTEPDTELTATQDGSASVDERPYFRFSRHTATSGRRLGRSGCILGCANRHPDAGHFQCPPDDDDDRAAWLSGGAQRGLGA